MTKSGNINEMGREAAAIKVIARMFGLRFDTLWQRHERTKRRKIIVWGTVAAIILVSSISAAAYMNALKNEAEKQRQRATIEQKRAEYNERRAQIERDSAEVNRRKAEVKEREAQIARDVAEKQTVIAQTEKDNAIKAKKSLEIANDSIKRQSELIAKTNENLRVANDSIKAQSQKILRAYEDLRKSKYDNVILDSHNTAYLTNNYINNGNATKSLNLIKLGLKNNPELLPIFEKQIRSAFDTINYTSYPYSIYGKLPYAISDIDFNIENREVWAVDGYTLKVWNYDTQEVLSYFQVHDNPQDMFNGSYNPLFNIFTTRESRGTYFSIFKVDQKHNLQLVEQRDKYDITFSPDNKQIWECNDWDEEYAVIRLIDLGSNKILRSFRGIISGWAPDKLSFVYSVGKWGDPIKYYYYDTRTHESTYLATLNEFVGVILTNDGKNIWYEESNGLECVYLRKSDNCPSQSSLLNSLSYGSGIIENTNPGFITIYNEGKIIPTYIGNRRVVTNAKEVNDSKLLLGCNSGEIILINNPLYIKKRFVYYRKDWENLISPSHRANELCDELLNSNLGITYDLDLIACQSNNKEFIIFSNENGNINLITNGKIDLRRNLQLDTNVNDVEISPDNKYFVILENEKFVIYRVSDFAEVYKFSLGNMLGHQLKIESTDFGYNIKIYCSHYEGPEEVPWDDNNVNTILDNTVEYIIDFPFYSLNYILDYIGIK